MGRMAIKVDDIGCEVCGNTNGEYFEVHLGGEKHVFDSFECAMHAFLPRCEFCGCRIVGHAVRLGDSIFCSYQCENDQHVRECEALVQISERANFYSNSPLQ